MKYRYLGNSGLAVSRVCLGTATFGQEGWGCDADASNKILNAYVEQGGNFVDTADKYAATKSEQIIGKWLAGQNRDELVIATKCFFKTSENINSRGLSRKHIINACDASLKRLQTDYIDLYQVHESDPQTPIEETLSALNTLVQHGKVRYLGLSNWPAWKVMKAAYTARDTGKAPFISGQYLYNLLKRDIEAEVIPACTESGLGIVCWCPLSGGMLTGKYIDADQPPEGTRLSERIDLAKERYAQWVIKSNTVVKSVVEVSNRCAVPPAVVSLSWLLKNDAISSVSVGAKRAEQIMECCKAGEWVLPDAEYRVLEKQSHISVGNPHDVCQTIARDWFNQIV
jgi:aryl-alcohol dehydrogenase-like predicted oxidoreductase